MFDHFTARLRAVTIIIACDKGQDMTGVIVSECLRMSERNKETAVSSMECLNCLGHQTSR